MTEVIFLVQEAPEGGLEAKALSASIFTEADSLDEPREMVRDAVTCHNVNSPQHACQVWDQ